MKKKIENWDYQDDLGSWKFENDEIKIFVSFWRHEHIRSAYICCVRWEYEGKCYASYLKLKRDKYVRMDQMLYEASMYVTSWLNDKKKEESATKEYATI